MSGLRSIDDVVRLASRDDCSMLRQFPRFQALHDVIPSLKKLNAMVGLAGVKERILDVVFYHLRARLCGKDPDLDAGMDNIIITGPPGVGKTQLAGAIAGIYAATGRLPSSKVVFANRSDLIGQYLGSTAQKTKKILDKAKGGVLFLDEVYTLGHKDQGDIFSKECIDTILQRMSERPNEFVLMVAGYAREVEECFLSQNKGLDRRFTVRLELEGYNATELMQIFKEKCTSGDWILEADTDRLLRENIFNPKDFEFFGGDMQALFHHSKLLSTRRYWSGETDTKPVLLFDDIVKAKSILLQRRTRVDSEAPMMYT
jgi:SpoVK/Ycf46/Vps4 family AAA+-type ATPase